MFDYMVSPLIERRWVKFKNERGSLTFHFYRWVGACCLSLAGSIVVQL